ncbi:D-tagatose-bisphosphate aldolase class II accessory protein AgaZ [Caldithrix abyssi DSM 13497]|uniref:D-tagatose-bisphosphate aldolase class II accessory protein AgaZ n=1 Tax=Caldithrix abyssi DSM 13497 TaxID=880073 RepID=H1XRG1_CALAY|nr:class II D-tagatose-bisphosphate aldolase, non-catalytic subunit [Caldithrix abyssi]APF18436.1 tagatose-bisphosphate aldolase noncatalytic subunit [Caldithrix abyssi DSM 13497]EHO42442.1 D-tagatose-bisphosphate aldolase class II accessory protein AgaZ [Caldithrix abyssi DSM 13497]
MSLHPLNKLIERHKKGTPVGIYSVCSANPFVLKAAMLQAQKDQSLLLIEATSNQVDQFGGYTGMRPEDFKTMTLELAAENNYDPQGLILGGDHLGPNRWTKLSASRAMDYAREQIAAYVKAGFSKIHLDATMPLQNDATDSAGRLPVETIAQRTAELCAVAEQTYRQSDQLFPPPVYIVGSDVPIPGGAQEALNQIHITEVKEVQQTIDHVRRAFEKNGLEAAYERVCAVVVQPGVEFADQIVFEYAPDRAAALKDFIESHSQLVYEAHSTDYQTAPLLRQMVKDHFAILKVGPALTFALREAIFALAFMEKELLPLHRALKPSAILETLDQTMDKNPAYWQKHYGGTKEEVRFAQRFSLSDRIRYYWPFPKVQKALRQLLKNLQQISIPLTLVSQFMPEEYQRIRQGTLTNDPQALILNKIQSVLKQYAEATQIQNSLTFTQNQNSLAMERL